MIIMAYSVYGWDMGPKKIPPEPMHSVLMDRASGQNYRLEVSGGSLTLVSVTSLNRFDTLFGGWDGPIVTREETETIPRAQVRLYVLSGSLSWEDVQINEAQWGVRNRVVAKDNSNGKVYRVDYPVSGALVLTELTG